METGAAKRLEEKNDDRFQYMPISSETMARSFSEAMMSRAVADRPARCSTIAASACAARPSRVHAFSSSSSRKADVFLSGAGTFAKLCR